MLCHRMPRIPTKLDFARRSAYFLAMIDPIAHTLEDVVADLEISEAAAAAGQSVPLEPILKRLLEHADRLDSETSGGPAPLDEAHGHRNLIRVWNRAGCQGDCVRSGLRSGAPAPHGFK